MRGPVRIISALWLKADAKLRGCLDEVAAGGVHKYEVARNQPAEFRAVFGDFVHCLGRVVIFGSQTFLTRDND
jgi:hypothetical protein